MTRIFTQAAARLKPLMLQELRAACGHLKPRRIVLKPNWVVHETDPAFPIAALITDARIIEAVVEACLSLFPGSESILVGDCPLQYANWPLMCRQSRLTPVLERLAKEDGEELQLAGTSVLRGVLGKDGAQALLAKGASILTDEQAKARIKSAIALIDRLP
jgi:hypothetical protein